MKKKSRLEAGLRNPGFVPDLGGTAQTLKLAFQNASTGSSPESATGVSGFAVIARKHRIPSWRTARRRCTVAGVEVLLPLRKT